MFVYTDNFVTFFDDLGKVPKLQSHRLSTCHNRATVTDTHNMGTWLEDCQRSNQISSGFH